MFGKDFFKITHFIFTLLKLIAKVFGDEEDDKISDEFENNHQTEYNAMINGTRPK